jgi:hypothetical protein
MVGLIRVTNVIDTKEMRNNETPLVLFDFRHQMLDATAVIICD